MCACSFVLPKVLLVCNVNADIHMGGCLLNTKKDSEADVQDGKYSPTSPADSPRSSPPASPRLPPNNDVLIHELLGEEGNIDKFGTLGTQPLEDDHLMVMFGDDWDGWDELFDDPTTDDHRAADGAVTCPVCPDQATGNDGNSNGNGSSDGNSDDGAASRSGRSDAAPMMEIAKRSGWVYVPWQRCGWFVYPQAHPHHSLNGHCANRAHGKRCHWDRRLCSERDSTRGRSAALTAAWLMSAFDPGCDTKADHDKMKQHLCSLDGFELRKQCREMLERDPSHEVQYILTDVERTLRDDEEPEIGAHKRR